MSKQVVVQRILPLQPGITQQPYSVLPTADVNYSIESSPIKPSSSSSSASASASSMEYKSSLTEENLSRMNNLSENTNSNSQQRSINDQSSNSSIRAIETSSTEHPNCGIEIKHCDMVDSRGDKLDPPAFDVVGIDEEENNRLRQRLDDDPGIQSLMEISLPSPIPIVSSTDECEFCY